MHLKTVAYFALKLTFTLFRGSVAVYELFKITLGHIYANLYSVAALLSELLL